MRPSPLFCGLTGPGLEVAQDQFPDGLERSPPGSCRHSCEVGGGVPAGENGDGVVVEVSVSAGLDPGVGESIQASQPVSPGLERSAGCSAASVSRRCWSGPGCWRGLAELVQCGCGH